MSRNIVGLAIVLFTVSWFVPVVEGQETAEAIRRLGDRGDSADGIPGWQACRVAWELLTSKRERGEDQSTHFLLGLTCLTSGAMVLAAVVLAVRPGRSPALGLLLLGCAVLDLGWIYHDTGDLRESLRAGYYLWTGSFALAGLGFLSRPSGRELASTQSGRQTRGSAPSREGFGQRPSARDRDFAVADPATASETAAIPRVGVVLQDAGPDPKRVAKELRLMPGVSPDQADGLVRAAPCTVVRDMKRDVAARVVRQLSQAGATADIDDSNTYV